MTKPYDSAVNGGGALTDVSTFDVETNIVDGTASPYHKDTRIVVAGELPDSRVVCGHNIAFDVLHALKIPEREYNDGPARSALQLWAREFLFNPNTVLWDTMIVDYLYHAGRHRSPSLEETCARWDVPFTKDPLIAEYFESGRGADVIIADGHEERLRTYHAEDLRATREVAIRQMAALHGTRLLPVVQVQLEALKFVCLEQFCGLPVDLIGLGAEADKARATLQLLEQDLRRMVGLEIFNPDSPEQVMIALNGGAIEEEKRVEVGVFGPKAAKAGQPRYKIERTEHPLPRRLDTPVANADEKVLSRLAANTTGWVPEFCKRVLEYRETAKLLGTYLEPIARQVALSFDGCLHGDINMAVTNTGRKSSSAPNLQNIPPVVRQLIRARPGWKIVAADFKQLEVIAWAYQSRDPALYKDLLAGVDIHTRTTDYVEQKTGRRPERTNVKRVNFGRIYGGGITALSAQSGVPEAVVSDIVRALDGLYPIGAAFGEKVQQALHANQRPYNDPDSPFQHYQAEYELPSGRRLWFRTYDAKPGKWNRKRNVTVEFSHTQCKNRPIQSFATADIVPLAEALCMRELQRIGPKVLEYIRPMVSVHDELVFEVRSENIDDILNLLHTIESNLTAEINKRFKLDPVFDLPLKIEVGVGDTWMEAKS